MGKVKVLSQDLMERGLIYLVLFYSTAFIRVVECFNHALLMIQRNISHKKCGCVMLGIDGPNLTKEKIVILDL